MEITKTSKNIFTLMKSDLKNEYYFINPVNTKGIMGKGLAKEFKIQYPSHFEQYKNACDENEIKIGKLFFDIQNHIIAFPTKDHWRGKSKIEYISKGLDDLILKTKEKNIKNIIMPKIGSGLGGLDFANIVLPLLKEKLSDTHLERVIISEWTTKK